MAAMVLLSALAVNKYISTGWFIFWMAVTTIILHFDAMYLDKHFVDGEWRS
jgi:hypothetical protein